MLGAAIVQIPKDSLDDLHLLRKEDGTLEIMDPQDLLVGLDVSLSRSTGFLRGASVVVVILVKGHAFPMIVKVRPVDLDFAQSVEIDHLKRTLSEHLKEKESLLQTVTILKMILRKKNLETSIGKYP
ncbi:hypothetical protein Tco_0048050 [Tanacetum coccineum]